MKPTENLCSDASLRSLSLVRVPGPQPPAAKA